MKRKKPTLRRKFRRQRNLIVQSLERRELLAVDVFEPTLLMDLNSQPPASGATQYVSVGSQLFFVADDGLHGDELFVIRNGGRGELVKDIVPGIDGSSISNMTAVGGTLFFTASTQETGTELWKSDGTASGTVLVRDINPNVTTYQYDETTTVFGHSSSPTQLTAVEDKLMFVANDGTSGDELWISDGTTSGTVIVADLIAGELGSAPRELLFAPTIDEGTLFFTADSDAIGRELWKMPIDGEPILVANVFPETTASGKAIYTEWTSDGKPVLRNQDGKLVIGQPLSPDSWEFINGDGSHLFHSDTRPFSSNPQNLVVFDGRLYFTATGVVLDSATEYTPVGRELWVTDGTEQGTMLSDDIALANQLISAVDVNGESFSLSIPRSSAPRDFVTTTNRLFFAATNVTSGAELYSRGSSAIPGADVTLLVKEINPGASSSNPTQLTRVGEQVFFAATSATGNELWRSNGTSAGTAMVRDIAPGSLASDPQSLTALNDSLIFTAVDGVHGREVWKSDGTAEGTVLLKDIRFGTNNSNSLAQGLTAHQDKVYFTASDFFRGVDVWRTDGTESGTVFVGVETIATITSDPRQLTRVGSKLFFVATSQQYGEELWVSDASTFGAQVVKDINPTTFGPVPLGSTPHHLVEFNGMLYFTAFDDTGVYLWKSDGTAQGTSYATMGEEGEPIPGPRDPSDLFVIGNTLFFTADEPDTGRELWAMDAVSGESRLLKDIDPTIFMGGNGDIPLSSQPLYMTAYANKLYFSASSPDFGREVWVSDGTPEGTVLRADIAVGGEFPPSSHPGSFVVSGNRLFFTAETPEFGSELWVFDNDSDPPRRITDLDEGPDGSHFSDLAAFADGVAFRHDDQFNGFDPAGQGNELWYSDGTTAGTRIVIDLEPGTEGSRCFNDFVGSSIVAFNDSIVFRANDLEHGCELFISDGTASGTRLLADLSEDVPIVPMQEGSSSYPDDFAVIGDSLYFQASTFDGRTLWRMAADETLERSPLGYNFLPFPSEITIAGSNLYMIGDDFIRGREIYSVPLQPSLTVEVMEILARDVAYTDWIETRTVSLPALGYGRFSTLEMTVDKVFNDPITGFQAVGLVSPSVDPVLAVRGSVDFLTDWFDDFHPDGVGTSQFLANYADVASWLNLARANFGAPSIVGHSLGGGLTQLIAAQYTSNGGELAQVVTFNAPGVNADYAAMFRQDLTESVVHYVTNGDPVSMAGDAFLAGRWVRSTFSDPNLINNHTHPVVVPFTFAGETRGVTRSRADDISYELFDDTSWISDPLYFHDDADYLTYLTVMYAVAIASPSLRSYAYLPASLLFRYTAESQRQTIGQVWHELQTPVLAAIGPTPCNPEHEPFALTDVEFSVFGLLDIEATGLMASCQLSPEPSLWLQGEIKLPEFYNVTANFTGDNRIQLANRQIEIVGTVTAEDIPVVPGFLTVKQAGIGIDTIAKTLQAGAQLDINPWGILLDVNLGFLNKQWNSITVGLDGIGIPVPVLPAAVLQRIQGSVDHIAESDPDPVSFEGSIGMTLGPTVNLDLPAWAGGPIEAKLLGFNGGARFDSSQLSIFADLNVAGGLATVNGTTTWNWDDGTLEAIGGFDILDGLIRSTQASFKASVGADSGLDIAAAASAVFTVPDIFPLIGGTQALSGDFFFQFTDDGQNDNDSTGAYAGFNLPLVGATGLGFRLWFDGSIALIGAEEIAELVDNGEGESTPSAAPPVYQVMLEPGKQWALFSAEWENETDSELLLTTPSGQTLTESQITADPSMAIVEEFTDRRRRVVIVDQPASGIWMLSVDNSDATGPIEFYSAGSNVIPSAAVTQLTGGGYGPNVEIQYTAVDSDDQAILSFYYDSDASGNDGILITSGIVESDGPGQWTWDTHEVPDGSYFIYMIVDDGINAPVVVYSADSVEVSKRFVEGTVWLDANGNGVMDAGDGNAADVTVFVDVDGDTVFDQGESYAITSADGTYRISGVSVGTQSVRIVTPFGTVQSFPSDDQGQLLMIDSETQLSGIDFAIRETPASITGVVWQDRDRDGYRATDELLRSAIPVRLISQATGQQIAQVLSANDGSFRFHGIVPGSYVVEVVTATIDGITLEDRPGSDLFDSNLDPSTARRSVELGTGLELTSIDIGLYSRWNHVENPYDVDVNGIVSPFDALLVINFLGLISAAPSSGELMPFPSTFPDVNGNSSITPLDALLVINRIALEMALTAPQGFLAEAERTELRIDTISPSPESVDALLAMPVFTAEIHESCTSKRSGDRLAPINRDEASEFEFESLIDELADQQWYRLAKA